MGEGDWDVVVGIRIGIGILPDVIASSVYHISQGPLEMHTAFFKPLELDGNYRLSQRVNY